MGARTLMLGRATIFRWGKQVCSVFINLSATMCVIWFDLNSPHNGVDKVGVRLDLENIVSVLIDDPENPEDTIAFDNIKAVAPGADYQMRGRSRITGRVTPWVCIFHLQA